MLKRWLAVQGNRHHHLHPSLLWHRHSNPTHFTVSALAGKQRRSGSLFPKSTTRKKSLPQRDKDESGRIVFDRSRAVTNATEYTICHRTLTEGTVETFIDYISISLAGINLLPICIWYVYKNKAVITIRKPAVRSDQNDLCLLTEANQLYFWLQ